MMPKGPARVGVPLFAAVALLVVTLPSAAADSRGLFQKYLSYLRSNVYTAVDRTELAPLGVLQAAENTVAEILVLREALGAFDFQLATELHERRTPVHMHFKLREIRRKVAEVQVRFDVRGSTLEGTPAPATDYKGVLADIEEVLECLRHIKSALEIEDEIATAPLRAGRSTAVLYRHLAYASSLLDGLRGRSTADKDVYQRT